MNKFAALIAFGLLSFDASATMFEGSYTVNVNGAEPWLTVTANPTESNISFNVDPGGQTSWMPLFQIYTSESWVNELDTVPIQASVKFSFSTPTDFSGTAYGTTYGESLFYGLWQQGKLTWANGGLTSLYFSGGILDVFLKDTTFGGGFLGLNDDPALVKARFAYRPGAGHVPEPGALALFGTGLITLALLRRRRNAAAKNAAA